MLWGRTGVGLLWEQGWVWGETTTLSDHWSSATFLGMVGGQCVWELGRARLNEAEGELNLQSRVHPGQGQACWLCEVGNPQMYNFQGSLNHVGWFLLEFPL